jgi:hypothetical protein
MPPRGLCLPWLGGEDSEPIGIRTSLAIAATSAMPGDPLARNSRSLRSARSATARASLLVSMSCRRFDYWQTRTR